MAEYLIEASYSTQSWEGMIREPQNRFEILKPALQSVNGTIKHAWFSFGATDIVLIIDVPDVVDAVAFSIATQATGALKSLKTTPLISVEQSIEAMGRAQHVKYTPPAKATAGVR